MSNQALSKPVLITGQAGALETVEPEDVRRRFETNAFGLLRLTRWALPGAGARR